jgi:hypothetical protein
MLIGGDASKIAFGQRIGIILAAMLLWADFTVQAQSQRPSPDVAPAVVVTVPSVSLASEQVAAVLLPASYAATR